MNVPEDLTVFQGLLPPELLAREHRDLWLKAPVFGRSLGRLRRARLSTAPLADLAPLCD
jgi:hypothetical protein